MENEIWKDIQGYEGLYEISSLGRVKKGDKIMSLVNTGYRCKYYAVALAKNGTKKRFYVHRLVAQAFLPNPNNLPQVNHKDENTHNNFVINLEWVSAKENANWGTRNERMGMKHWKPVIQYDIQGNFMKEWENMSNIERETGMCRRNISKCCKGKYKQAYGYLWAYK